ncbi:MAG: Bax inhibitor-1/YccA family protein [Verrucomicrobiales bacterium]|nr:Bax inhibitor-1/YccA family protein [Verrucomicrobiales bacterium]
MRTSNPVLRADTFALPSTSGASMTIGGTVAKTAFFLLLALVPALATYSLAVRGLAVGPWMMAGGIGGLVLAVVTAFKPAWASITGSLYCLAQGLVLGGLSAHFEQRFPGIAISAAGCTLGTLAGLLLAYQSGLIRVTEKFRMGIFAATAGIALFYLVSFVLRLFGIQVPYIHESGLIGIGFSAFVVIVAALNLVLDFDFIEQGASHGAPKYMEWYAAFGLMVTLIWLYIEILRLLAKIMGRRS